jgi:membrane protein DedA with SNARE-associated domain
VSALTYAGYVLGEHYDKVDEYLAPVSKIVLLGLLVAAGIWLEKRRQEQKRRKG